MGVFGMFGIVMSALNAVLRYLLRDVVIKYLVFFALFWVVFEFTLVLNPLLPTGDDVSPALAGIPASVWYFLDIFNVNVGIPAVLSAHATRFIIRRFPLIG